MKLSEDLQISLTVAISEAGRLGHEYAGLEHLLYALTFDEETARVLKNAGADLDQVREDLAEYLSEELEKVEDEGLQPRLTLGVQRVLSMAAARVEGTGKQEIKGSDVLVALFDETDSYAVAGAGERGGEPARRGELPRPRRLQAPAALLQWLLALRSARRRRG